MHAGHYITRYYTSTRWDETNVHPQCNNCNVNLGGNLERYKLRLIEVYGDKKPQELHRKSQQTTKLYDYEIAELIALYRNKL